jgi:plasmid maintenance system antidote protein VapI
MKFNYAKLLGRIREFGLTQESLAKEIGRSLSTFNAKIKNNGCFSADEIYRICKVLEIAKDEIGDYFFTV